MQNFTSIPFKTESGISSVNGLAKFSTAGVVIEFESKYFGLISNGIKEVRLSIDEIHDVRFKKGFFRYGAKIEIRTNTLARLIELPNKEGKLTLKLHRDDFERASDAVLELQKNIVSLTAELPPPHPPLRSLFDESELDTKELEQKDDR